MLIANWMTTDPVSVSPTTSLSKCQKLLKTHQIRRLPVVDTDNVVVGIISDRDVKSASPSKATSLEVHEMQYLLAEVKARDIMTVNPITVTPNTSMGTVALILLEKKIGGLPVVDEERRLLGIITDQDVFKALVTIAGARIPGLDITIETSNNPGSLGKVFDVIRQNDGHIISVMTAYLDNGNRHVFLRLHPLENADRETAIKQGIAENATILEWAVADAQAIAE